MPGRLRVLLGWALLLGLALGLHLYAPHAPTPSPAARLWPRFADQHRPPSPALPGLPAAR